MSLRRSCLAMLVRRGSARYKLQRFRRLAMRRTTKEKYRSSWTGSIRDIATIWSELYARMSADMSSCRERSQRLGVESGMRGCVKSRTEDRGRPARTLGDHQAYRGALLSRKGQFRGIRTESKSLHHHRRRHRGQKQDRKVFP